MPNVPRHIECLADDRATGMVVIIGVGVFSLGLGGFMGWTDFLEAVPVLSVPLMVVGLVVGLFAGVHLRQGCRPLLRINFNGVTDFRNHPATIPWSDVESIHMSSGLFGRLLGVIKVQLKRPVPVRVGFWFFLFHLSGRLFGKSCMILPCVLLDQSARDIAQAMDSHLS
ncbi:MAG: hypothetical protein HQL54_07965 [Magnetococcales bacterium]|nr:hypothetical protein [Magnetococcales bacterium]